MTSTNDTRSVSSSGQNSRKSFASRVSSLIGSKSSHIGSYDIELDEPYKLYAAGDKIKGKVVLEVLRPLGITHIVVCLFGYVEVFKNHSKAVKSRPRNNTTRVAKQSGKRWVSEYYGDGYASLFEDEHVICGQGRLDPKLYHFRFEVEFPMDMQLPTSRDFERGTISYVISSTITRPTTLTQTISRESKVQYRETIDVAAYPVPKPRVITLEPIDRSTGKKTALKRLKSYNVEHRTTSVLSDRSKTDRSARTGTSTSVGDEASNSRARSSSLRSSTSAPSSSARDSLHPSEHQSSVQCHSPRPDTESSDSKTITATIEQSRAACLPGDVVQIKINIQHTKAVQSLNGVIVTLYRQARTDMHPNLPLASSQDGGKKKYEDYYPRSKTGLGGISLSAAGSSQTWRKDLSQTIAPLYVDPDTKTAEIKVGARVPDDVFPSIRTAPGGMISFNYHIEVIIDIHGKLGISTYGSSNPEMAPGQFIGHGDAVAVPGEENKGSGFTAWGLNCMDTAQLRRDRNAVGCACDLVIGTKDTTKARGKQRQVDGDSTPQASAGMEQNGYNEPHYDSRTQHDNNYYNEYYDGYDYYDPNFYGYTDGNLYNGYGTSNDIPHPAQRHHHNTTNLTPPRSDTHHPPPFIPPPAMPFPDALSEKDRIRLAEQQLLPSQPPPPTNDGTQPSAPDVSGVDNTPIAPYLPDAQNYDSPQAYQDAVAASSQHPPVFSSRTYQDELQSDSATRQTLAVDADPRLPSYTPPGHTPMDEHPSDLARPTNLSSSPALANSTSASHPANDPPSSVEAMASGSGTADQFAPSAPPAEDVTPRILVNDAETPDAPSDSTHSPAILQAADTRVQNKKAPSRGEIKNDDPDQTQVANEDQTNPKHDESNDDR